jgi:hypothetical protein
MRVFAGAENVTSFEAFGSAIFSLAGETSGGSGGDPVPGADAPRML